MALLLPVEQDTVERCCEGEEKLKLSRALHSAQDAAASRMPALSPGSSGSLVPFALCCHSLASGLTYTGLLGVPSAVSGYSLFWFTLLLRALRMVSNQPARAELDDDFLDHISCHKSNVPSAGAPNPV